MADGTSTRRDFLRAAGFGAAALAVPRAVAGQPTGGRPNVLFIMSDDHAAPAISAYGGFLAKAAPTPNIDRIAKEGMLFRNCFCTNSICTPSRATIFTGKYSHMNGVYGFTPLDQSQPTLPKLMRKHGYHTGIVGKYHLHSNPRGFDYWSVLPGQGSYHNPEFVEMGGEHPSDRVQRGKRTRYRGHSSDVIGDKALAYLKSIRPKDKPFCFMFQLKAPHDPWQHAERYADLYKDEKLPEPPTLLDDYATRSDALRKTLQYIGSKWGNHTNYNRQTGHLEGPARKRAQYQEYIKRYLRCVAGVDHNVGRVLDYLDESGLAKNTIVIYTADQGFFLGEHGLYDKRLMYEEALRMPFLVRWPGVVKPGSVNEDIVLNVDFAPTILAAAGEAVPGDMQGRSVVPLLGGRRPADWRKSMYYRYYFSHFRTEPHFGVRTREHKLICFHRIDQWELYDLVKDPLELRNEYANPEYGDLVARLKRELTRLQEELGDDPENEGGRRRRAPSGRKARLTKGPLGWKLATSGSHVDVSLKKTPKAYRNRAVFKLRLQAAVETGARNGFFVFGSGPAPADRMRCGVYIGAGTYAIEKGTDATQEGTVVKASFDHRKVFDVSVTVDIRNRKVEMSVDGKPALSAPLAPRIKQVTHFGYGCWSTTETHFSDVSISGE